MSTWSDVDRPLIVSEFGDWGLPQMPESTEPPFWDTRAVYATALAATLWPGTLSRFVRETQRYQGLSDRLQAEVFRRHDHIAGYVVTELTDVPFELNGLLDLHRRPKPLAVVEMRRLNQPVLPIVEIDSLVVEAGEPLTAAVHVANDGPALEEVQIEARFGSAAPVVGMEHLLHVDGSRMSQEQIFSRFQDDTWAARVARMDGHGTTHVGTLTVRAPTSAGAHHLVVRLSTHQEVLAANSYPFHVVERPELAGLSVRDDHLSETLADALESLGAKRDRHGLLVIGENALDAHAGWTAARALERGETVLVLAQTPEAASHFPLPIVLEPLETTWGSSVFHFTTDNGALPSLPRRNVLVAEDSTVHATSIVTRFADTTHPDTPVVLAFKPFPGSITGTVVGSAAVGAGRLVFCQYRVGEPAATGDAAARALLADLVRWAGQPHSVLRTDRTELADGRGVARYRYESRAAE